MAKFATVFAVFGALALLAPSYVTADSCPADEHDGVRVQGCQIGDDIQVLAHNNNSYEVSVDVNVSYREKGGAVHSRSFNARVQAGGGGQIGEIQVRPYRTLAEVSEVTLKDVTQR